MLPPNSSMKIRTVFFSFMRLAAGEVFGRMATFALFAYISRQFGVEILGIVALAQTVASYVMEVSDQGLKLIGARLLARNAALIGYLVRFVLKRRAALTAIAVLLGAAYALFGPIGTEERVSGPEQNGDRSKGRPPLEHKPYQVANQSGIARQ